MDKREFHIGPGAASLMLVAVVVCMSVLGLLALSEVRNDVRLTERSRTLIEARYRAEVRAERDYAALCALVRTEAFALDPEEALQAAFGDRMTLEDDLVRWQADEAELCRLQCAVRLNARADGLPAWTEHSFVSLLDESAAFEPDVAV